MRSTCGCHRQRSNSGPLDEQVASGVEAPVEVDAVVALEPRVAFDAGAFIDDVLVHLRALERGGGPGAATVRGVVGGEGGGESAATDELIMECGVVVVVGHVVRLAGKQVAPREVRVREAPEGLVAADRAEAIEAVGHVDDEVEGGSYAGSFERGTFTGRQPLVVCDARSLG